MLCRDPNLKKTGLMWPLHHCKKKQNKKQNNYSLLIKAKRRIKMYQHHSYIYIAKVWFIPTVWTTKYSIKSGINIYWQVILQCLLCIISSVSASEVTCLLCMSLNVTLRVSQGSTKNSQIKATHAAGFKPRTLLLWGLGGNVRSGNIRKFHTTPKLLLMRWWHEDAAVPGSS